MRNFKDVDMVLTLHPFVDHSVLEIRGLRGRLFAISCHELHRCQVTQRTVWPMVA